MRGKIVYNGDTYEWNTEIEECKINGKINVIVILKKQVGIKKRMFKGFEPIYQYRSVTLLSNDDGESKLDVFKEFNNYTIKMIEDHILTFLEQKDKSLEEQKEINDFIKKVENKITGI